MSATTLSNTLNNLQRTLQNSSTNISNAKAVGGFNVEAVYQSQSSTGLGGGSRIFLRNDFIMKGEFNSTGIQSDLAIGGRGTTGLFCVKRSNGDICFTGNGSIRQGQTGGFYLADGSAILGWQYDVNGSLPTNTSTTSSLTPLTLRNAASKAIPTTKVNLGVNLKASQKAIQGAGGILNITKNNITNTSNAKEIITPGNTPLGELHIGDQLILQTSDVGTDYTFEYGGIAISKKISATNTMYGKTTVNEFNISAAASSATNLQEGSGLTITIGGGKSYTFKATSQAGAASTLQFNSMQSLADAISATKDLNARVVDGRLYVSAYDADLALTFADTNASLLTATLGLDPVIVSAGGTTKRFATVEELQQKVAATTGLAGELDDAGNLSFNAASPLATLRLGGRNQNSRSIFTVKAGPATASTRTTQLANIATIQANNHGLKVGDFVRLSSGVAPISAGTFRVQEVGADGDSFSIGTMANIVAGDITGGVLAQGGVLDATPKTGEFKWQKVDGGNEATAIITGAAAATATSTTDGAGVGTIAGLAAGTISVGYQLVANDVVYIANSTSVLDGYYRVVTRVDATSFTFTYIDNVLANPLSDLKLVAGGPRADTGISITKVSSPNGVAATGFETFPLLLTTATKNVTIDVGTGHNHKVGDVLAFRDTATATVTRDNVIITKDKYYKISSVTATTITFEADGAVATGANRIGFRASLTAGGALVGEALVGTDANTLGAKAYIDYIGREYKGLGIDIRTGEDALTPITDVLMNAPLASTYDPASTEKSFASGNITKRIFTTPVSIVDNLGIQHDLSIVFGKIAQNQWAVEINTAKNANGTYDAGASKKGQLAYGNITFDGTGQLSNVANNLSAPLIINWTNGAVSSNVTFDWGAIGGESADGKAITIGLTQIDSDSNTRFVDGDGKLPGNINGFKFDEHGVLFATFDNGTTIAVGKIALATFSNFNGLDQKDGFLYASSDSGVVLLKEAGVGGAGEILVGGITSSAVNDTNEYMGVIDTTQASAMAVNIAAKINGARDQLVSGLAR